MTYRLVGLMSFVLLLSLAAFGLLMSSYQDQVMQELTRTVSTVGRTALNTFAFHSGDTDDAKPGFAYRRRFAEKKVEGLPPRVSYEMKQQTEQTGEDSRKVVLITTGQRWVTGAEDQEVVDGAPPAELLTRLEEATPKEAVEDTSGSAHAIVWTYMVQVDDVQAEENPDEGLVLRIPTIRAESRDPLPDHPARMESEFVSLGRLPAGEPAALGENADILLPIPTEDYQDLFSDIRGRSLFLFLGVFVVGTVLSAMLAARFTRPIRLLDRGIRRLSEGDLDVQIAVDRSDEIGRLGRAFNEMTRKLRASHDRERELTRREKLSALGRLAAGVAHDVRNPLHSIGLTLQHVQETCRPGSEKQGRELDRSLGVIREEIGRLDRLIENFLRFARSDRRKRQPVDLAELVRETARLVHKEAEWRGIEVNVVVDGAVPNIEGDVESLRSSVLNLVLNSFEAMPEGGKVSLTVRGGSGEVRLEVADTGGGIPEEDQERVFEFAYTTREGGHGLGLAMVHQCVVEEHGGRVSLESRPGAGTRVLMGFPLRPEQQRPELIAAMQPTPEGAT